VHKCAITVAGAAYCWGYDTNGSLGAGGTRMNQLDLTPSAVVGGLAFSAISVSDHSCALTTAGAAYCWGPNSYGYLGNGTRTDSTSPVAVAGGLTFTALSAKGSSCAVTRAGEIWCWGPNDSGQLGDCTTTGRLTPVQVREAPSS
jgi:alpha-tubulin suppressor-like RCC1 family protein